MKRFSIIIIVVLTVLLVFSGCSNTQNETNEQKVENYTEVTADDSKNISEHNGLQLYKANLAQGSHLILVYADYDSAKMQFCSYDLKSNKIVSESEIYSINDYNIKSIKFLENYFYIFSASECCVFDLNCNLTDKFPIPENITKNFDSENFWLSNDLKKAAYVKYKNNYGDILYFSDSNGQNEKQVRPLDADLVISDLFFFYNTQYIGFCGVSIPEGKDLSEDCYGYIDLSSSKTTMFFEDNTYALHQGDMMMICNTTQAYDSVPDGVIKIININTKEKKEIALDSPKECETAAFASEGDYIAAYHYNEDKMQVVFTIYKGIKKIKSIDYKCSNEQELIDLTGSDVTLQADMQTKQLLVFHYNTEKNSYDILFVPFDI